MVLFNSANVENYSKKWKLTHWALDLSIPMPRRFFYSVSVILCLLIPLFSNANTQTLVTDTSDVLTLEKALDLAQKNDDWLTKSRFEEQSLRDLSKGATALPDPVLIIGLLNLPTDGFAFDQEPMTQFKVGANQMFPRGDTLSLKQSQFEQRAAIQPFLRRDRQRKVRLQTSLLWLDGFLSQANYRLIEKSKPLFDKLTEIVSAQYASSLGRTNQQDIIRAELELVRLKDRLVDLQSAQHTAMARLSQYLTPSETIVERYKPPLMLTVLPDEMPAPSDHDTALLARLVSQDDQTLFEHLAQHPVIAAKDADIAAQALNTDIAKQAYKPQYGVNASYAFRDDSPQTQGGNSRPDFFSINLTVSLPLFSNARQDSKVSSAVQQVEALRTEKRLLLRELMAGLKSSIERYEGASTRLDIYENQIIPQMAQLADAALNAYTNDRGDFAEVVRARIAELDAKMTANTIRVTQHKAIAEMRYYFSARLDDRARQHLFNSHQAGSKPSQLED